MKKFIVFCLMAFVMCVNANAQDARFEDGIYAIREHTNNRLTAEQYDRVKDFALTSGTTFHYEYEPTMYLKGRTNQTIGYTLAGIGVIGNAITAIALTSSCNYGNLSDDEYARGILISNIIFGLVDIAGITYWSVGTHQKLKSRIAVSPAGVRIYF